MLHATADPTATSPSLKQNAGVHHISANVEIYGRRRLTPTPELHTGSTTSMDLLPAPERSIDETGTSPEGLIPLRRRRLSNAGRNPKPRPARTEPTTYNTNRQGTHGLHHLTMPHGPSEAEETAGTAGGGRIAFFSPLATVATERLRERGKKCCSYGYLGCLSLGNMHATKN
jgi:hypothetical protein